VKPEATMMKRVVRGHDSECEDHDNGGNRQAYKDKAARRNAVANAKSESSGKRGSDVGDEREKEQGIQRRRGESTAVNASNDREKERKHQKTR
jgi:hypothetical protein